MASKKSNTVKKTTKNSKESAIAARVVDDSGDTPSAPTKFRQQPSSSSSSKSSTNTKGSMDRHILTEIFNKITEFGGERSDQEYFETLAQRLDGITIDQVSAAAKSKFENIKDEQAISMSTSSDGSPHPCEVLMREKIVSIRQLEESIMTSIAKYKTLIRDESLLSAEKMRLLQSLETSEELSRTLQESCRKMQRRKKESLEEVEKNRMEEMERTNELKISCEKSISEVITSVEQEEKILEEKEAENVQLRGKIDSFLVHLAVREQHMEAQSRARNLQQQIIVAKRAQIENFEAQCQLKIENYGQRLEHQRSGVVKLQEQINHYKTRFHEFGSSLDDTKLLFQHFTQRGVELTTKASEHEQRNQKIINKAEAKHKELEVVKARKLAAQRELEAVQIECAEEEKVCRELNDRRTKLSKQLEALKAAAMSSSPAVVDVERQDGKTDEVASAATWAEGAEEESATSDPAVTSDEAQPVTASSASSSSSSSSSSSRSKRALYEACSPGRDECELVADTLAEQSRRPSWEADS